mmetsp:Transcript_1314/g.2256  ORF Transcript_1314/g.2256 Transcript_1314/m.2256 type:complete len:630 (+) Transcript_1314:190-2079(+)
MRIDSPVGRSSKVQCTEVWGNQMELTMQGILKLREGKNEQLGILLPAYLGGRISEEKYENLSAPLKAQIAETQKEIQAKEAKLEEVIKEFKEAQAMETEESGTLRKAEIETTRKYNNDFKLLFETKIEKIEDPTGGDRKYGILRWNRKILRKRHSQVIYCRSCYFEIAEKIEKLLRSGNVDKILITGMPGGGKTTAALMVLKKLKEVFEFPCLFQFGSLWVWIPKQFPKKGEVEVFHSREHAIGCLLRVAEGKVFNFIDPQGENPIADLDNQNIIHVGWVSPKRASLLTGIKKRDMNDLFNKKASERIIFPTWVSEEIKDCRLRCYTQLSESEMIERMKKWGPSLRYIFEKSEDIDEVVNSVKRNELEDFFYSTKQSAEAFTSGRLAHMVPQSRGLGGKYYFRFASAYVSNLFRKKFTTFFIKMARYKVSAAAKGAIENHEYADWLERLTTIHFTNMDGTFKPTRKLVTPDKKTGPDLEVDLKNIKGHEYVTQKNFQDCEFKVDTYYEPSWRNLESIDSLFLSGKILYLIQITFSLRHPVKTAGIGAVWKAAKERHSDLDGYVLIFVLPEGSSRRGKDYVKDFAYQSYVKSNGKVVEHGKVGGFPQLKSELGQYLFVLPGVLEPEKKET